MLKRSGRLLGKLRVALPIALFSVLGACLPAQTQGTQPQNTTQSAAEAAYAQNQAVNGLQSSVYSGNTATSLPTNNAINQVFANPFSANTNSSVNSQYIGTQQPAINTFQTIPTQNSSTQNIGSNISTGNCSFDAAAAEHAIIAETNAFRRSQGITRDYQAHSGLGSMARTWTGQLAGLGRLQHRTENDLLSHAGQFGFRQIGENIANTQGFSFNSPQAAARQFVLDNWANSTQGHREAMLSTSFTHIGAGIYCTGNGVVYAAQNFGQQ